MKNHNCKRLLQIGKNYKICEPKVIQFNAGG